MKTSKLFAVCTLLALLLVPAAVWAQEPAAPERGVMEFGFRGVTGEVYGRSFLASTTAPGSNLYPKLLNSPLNAYSDYRNAFYIPKFNVQLDQLFGSNTYIRMQSASNGFAFNGGGSPSRDQSVLVTLGQYGHYKLQFRYDQTPHIFTGTTSTMFTSGGAGVWNVNPALQSALYNALKAPPSGNAGVSAIANALNGAVTGTLVPGVSGVQAFTQQENRKAITGLMSWNLTPNVNLFAVFSREHQAGTRPIGFVMGASSTGYIAEAPESINYYTNNVKAGTEFGQKHWDASVAYQGSFFQNDTPSMLVTNPFSTVYNNTTVGPATARMDLYPDNNYQQFVGQGAVELGKRVHLMVNVTPGWISQTANFQPLTTNTFLASTPPAGYPDFVPTKNLDGKVNTLAMNYTAVFQAAKSLAFTAKYQHYRYDNQTPDLLLRPTVADTSYLVSTSFHGSTAGCFDPVKDPNKTYTIDATYTYYCDAEQTSFTSKTVRRGRHLVLHQKELGEVRLSAGLDGPHAPRSGRDHRGFALWRPRHAPAQAPAAAGFRTSPEPPAARWRGGVRGRYQQPVFAHA